MSTVVNYPPTEYLRHEGFTQSLCINHQSLNTKKSTKNKMHSLINQVYHDLFNEYMFFLTTCNSIYSKIFFSTGPDTNFFSLNRM